MSTKNLPVSITIGGIVMHFAGFGSFPPQYAATKQLNPRAAVYYSEDKTSWTHSDARDFKARDTTADVVPAGGGVNVGTYFQPNVDARGGITIVEYQNGAPVEIILSVEASGDKGVKIAASICQCLNSAMYGYTV